MLDISNESHAAIHARSDSASMIAEEVCATRRIEAQSLGRLADLSHHNPSQRGQIHEGLLVLPQKLALLLV